jgi:hypothetical protein
MNFRNKRTCGIKDRQSKRGSFRLDGAGNPMGTKNRPGASGNLIQALDKPRALRFEGRHIDCEQFHGGHRMADIERWPIFFECPFDDFDRPDDTGTKPARLH